MTTADTVRSQLAATVAGVYGPVGPVIDLPPGDLVLDSPLVISNRADCTIRGAGPFSTRLIGQVVFDGCLNCSLEDLSINGAGGDITLQIKSSDGTHGWPISSDNKFRNLMIENAKTGVFIDSRSRDQNNEFHLFDSVQVSNCVDAGFRIWGGQCHRIQFRRCSASGTKIGLFAEYGNYWSWLDGQCTGNDVDFVVGSFWVEVQIERHRSEGSRSFLLTSGEWSPMPVTIRNVTWDGNPLPDRDVINIQSNGPIVMEAVQLSGINGITPKVRIFDHDYGSVDLSGLQIVTYDPPLGDVCQKPVTLPAWFDVNAFGCRERVLTSGGGNDERKLDIRPADDVTWGRLPISTPRPHYTYGVDYDRVPSPLPPSAVTEPRSFAVAFTVNLDAASITGHQSILTGNGHWIRLLVYPDHWQWRNEVGASLDVPLVEPGVPYRVAMSYDRDTHENHLTVNGVPAINYGVCSQWRQCEADNVTLTSDWSWGVPITQFPGGGRFGGAVTDAFVWDRSLSAAEMLLA